MTRTRDSYSPAVRGRRAVRRLPARPDASSRRGSLLLVHVVAEAHDRAPPVSAFFSQASASDANPDPTMRIAERSAGRRPARRGRWPCREAWSGARTSPGAARSVSVIRPTEAPRAARRTTGRERIGHGGPRLPPDPPSRTRSQGPGLRRRRACLDPFPARARFISALNPFRHRIFPHTEGRTTPAKGGSCRFPPHFICALPESTLVDHGEFHHFVHSKEAKSTRVVYAYFGPYSVGSSACRASFPFSPPPFWPSW